jgi:hypothetical protein
MAIFLKLNLLLVAALGAWIAFHFDMAKLQGGDTALMIVAGSFVLLLLFSFLAFVSRVFFFGVLIFYLVSAYGQYLDMGRLQNSAQKLGSEIRGNMAK